MFNHFYLPVDAYIVSIYTDDDPISSLLTEAQHKGIPIGGKYSLQKHSPHIPDSDYHLHVYARKNQILAINKDGTAHDGSHGVIIPNVVANAIRSMFPDWQLPPNNVIEVCTPMHGKTFLLEMMADRPELTDDE
jgi:hypothetical protein